jgi:putative hydrolase of the HAD superfamily
MTYEAVFFDLDDTLYPYPPCNEAGKRAAFEQARELGYDFDRESFDDLYQEARRETKHELAGTASAHERFLYFKRAMELETGTSRSADALALGEAYWDAFVDAISAFDGVEDTFGEFQARGISVAIVTNLTTRIQLRKLDTLGIENDVDLLLTSQETGREKPGSVMFTLPLARLSLTPEEVLMVGDNPDSDIAGGNAVGLDTVLFDPDADLDELEGYRQPDFHIDEFADVREVVA